MITINFNNQPKYMNDMINDKFLGYPIDTDTFYHIACWMFWNFYSTIKANPDFSYALKKVQQIQASLENNWALVEV